MQHRHVLIVNIFVGVCILNISKMKNDRILYIRTQTHKVTIYNTPKGCVVGSLLRRKI